MRISTRLLAFPLVLFILSVDVTFGQLAGQVPLKPNKIPQFVDPLPHFAGVRIDASGVDASGGKLIIEYVPFQTQVPLSTGTRLATGVAGRLGAGIARLWGYRISNDGGKTFTPPLWPAYTIVAQKGRPVEVEYRNKLDGETYASVNLIADQTLHWADPLMEMDPKNINPYEGPIPVSPHLHGGEVPSESDGGPDSWFTPGLSPKTGPSWNDGVDAIYNYPNTQESATLWWHDHALGVTRLNVYAGLAGFYFLKGPEEEDAKLPGWSGDGKVQEMSPAVANTPISDPYLPEIEMVFQDRMFDVNGQLYFPNLPPNPADHPFWTPEFVGDVITVNGKTWPYLSVAQRRYRFRLLNGSNARFYQVWLQDLATGAMGPQIVQIGTDGGLLDKPVPIVGKLLLAPGERADVIIDFTNSAPGQLWTLRNSARTPFPGGAPVNGSTTGRLMQFIVNGKMIGTDKSVDPLTAPSLRKEPLVKLTDFAGNLNVVPDKTRQLTLNEVMGMGGPLEVLVNNSKWDMNGMMVPGLGVTENPVEGTTEKWQIINLTADAHPIHLHLVQFQLVSRQPFDIKNYTLAYNASFPGGAYLSSVGPPLAYNDLNADNAVGGNPAITPFLLGLPLPPNPNENGWKDTYIVYPGEVTTFIIRYAPTDLPLSTKPENLQFSFDPSAGPGYVWHCHIIDHEDNEMMRPYIVERSPYRPAAIVTANMLKSSKISSTTGTEAAKGTLSPKSADLMSVQGKDVILGQNFPNPATDETEIRFYLPESAHVRLTLYNSLGQTVKVLIDSNAPAGTNTARLNIESLKDGVYYYRLNTGTFSSVKTMIVKK
jgi:spore coat protein A, manganese oxidase